MTTLAANCSASDIVIVVTPGSAPVAGFRFRIDDEILQYLGPDRSNTARILAYLQGDRTRWRVERGQEGTTAATHTSGDTLYAVSEAVATGENLTPPSPFLEGGSSTSVVQLATKHLTTANLIAIGDPGNKFEIAPAVPGSYYSVIAVDLRLNHGTTEFTVSDTSFIGVGSVVGPRSFVDQFAWGDFIYADGSTVLQLTRTVFPNTAGMSLANLVGSALGIWGSASVTIADGDGSVDVEVLYRLVTP